MSNNNVQVNGGTTGGGSSNTNTNSGQHSASTGHDLHGQSGVPLMHRTVDELLSADFPIVVRPDQGAGGQGNIMEGLDIFSDDFPAVNANLGLHMPQTSQPLSSGIHFAASQSPQGGLSPMQQQQVQQMQGQGLLQPQQQLPSTPSQLSRSPHVSPAIAHAALPAQQAPSVLSHQYPHQLQPGVVAARPVYQLQPGQQQIQIMNQQQLMNQQAPRPAQPNAQMPGHPQAPGVPTSQPTMPSAVRPPATTGPSATPIAQAGSPLHHILSSCSPATRVQLNNLFGLLQVTLTKPVTVPSAEDTGDIRTNMPQLYLPTKSLLEQLSITK
ncbi:MAG: hypothetical protein J3Q66DRAFT_46392 [Benniella sp.]|nr:MAG: hypothetical protein J3Q66DRAFT_46392 [Benniella sp.]